MGKTICLAVIVKITKCSLLINVPVNQTISSRRCDVKSGNIQGRELKMKSCYHKILDSFNQGFHLPLSQYVMKRAINIYSNGKL